MSDNKSIEELKKEKEQLETEAKEGNKQLFDSLFKAMNGFVVSLKNLITASNSLEKRISALESVVFADKNKSPKDMLN